MIGKMGHKDQKKACGQKKVAIICHPWDLQFSGGPRLISGLKHLT